MHLEVLGFPIWVVPSNTGIFACFKTMWRKQNLVGVLGIQKKIWGNRAFFRDNKTSIGKKTPYIALYFTVFLQYLLLYYL